MTPKEILKQYWGYDTFRPMQEEIIQSVLQGSDTLALLPTGGGKSVCFQIPAMCREGLCLVISPLIALMKDQVYNLNKKGIKARALFSGMSFREMDITLENCIHGDIKLLYVSPERLVTDLFLERVKSMKINLLAVDEAHCISQWGYDFRPPYLRIAEIRQYIPDTKVLALTASATPRVEKDIQDKLNFVNQHVFRKSFERKNISLVVTKTDDKSGEILKILKAVGGTAIIYVRNRRKTKQVADFLRKRNISADHYHAGLNTAERSRKQDSWIKGQTRVIACTNAFGMGIDKPDVRVVIHIDLPDSLEAYYQEAGRAGRDDKRSYAVVLFDDGDLAELVKSIDQKYPSVAEIRHVYDCLCQFLQLAVGAGKWQAFDFDIYAFCKIFKLDSRKAYNVLKVMEQEGYIATTDAVFLSSRLKVVADRLTLYKIEVSNEKMEGLIKLILRSYEGAMDHFVKIDEKEIARRLAKTVDEVIKELLALQRAGLLYYEPVVDKAQLVMLTERMTPTNLSINTKRLQELKNIYRSQVNAVINYITNHFTCRSRGLIGYFGEEDLPRCDHCDVCIKRNKLPLSADEMESIASTLKNSLSEKPYSVKELSEGKSKSEIEKITQVARWLADSGQIQMVDFNRMKWLG